MKKIWEKLVFKSYVVGMVAVVAVLGTVYFVFLKWEDETSTNPMEEVGSTSETMVLPEKTKKPWASSEVVKEQETIVTEQSRDIEVSEPDPVETPLPENKEETEATPKPKEEEKELPTSEPTQSTTPEVTPEPVPENTPKPTVPQTPDPVPEETPEVNQESVPEATPEPTPEPTPEATPEPAVPTEEPCVHHWLFDSYFQEPTCSNGGLENQICARCGATRTVAGTPTGKHSFVVETKGDCIGAEIVRCEECNTREIGEKDISNHIDVEDGFCFGCGTKTE